MGIYMRGMAMKHALLMVAAAALLGSAGCSESQGGWSPGVYSAFAPEYATAVMGEAGGPGAGHGAGMMMMGSSGMMGGPAMIREYFLPDLTDAQRAELSAIQRDFSAQQWRLMQQMRQGMWSTRYARSTGTEFDEAGARKSFELAAGLQREMFENSIQARRRMDAVLTPEQRERLYQDPWDR